MAKVLNLHEMTEYSLGTDRVVIFDPLVPKQLSDAADRMRELVGSDWRIDVIEQLRNGRVKYVYSPDPDA